MLRAAAQTYTICGMRQDVLMFVMTHQVLAVPYIEHSVQALVDVSMEYV
jgi:hypothetical protein